MSEENVEIVRKGLAQLGATGRPSSLAAPDLGWDMSHFEGWPDKDIYTGRDGFAAFIGEWTAPYEQWTLDIEELVEIDDVRVLAVMIQRGLITGTTSEVELRFAGIYTVEGGLIARGECYSNVAEAFEAAGLRE